MSRNCAGASCTIAATPRFGTTAVILGFQISFKSQFDEKSVGKAERIASSEAETGKEDYYVNLVKQARALKKARAGGARTETHKEFGTPTIEGDGIILQLAEDHRDVDS